MQIKVADNGNEICLSTQGAQIQYWTVSGKPIIFPAQDSSNGRQRGGFPMCFPFFGTPPKEMASLEKHGWLRNEIFEIWEAGHYPGEGMRFKFHSTSTLIRTEYPWLLGYEIEYLCHPKSLEVILQIFGDPKNYSAPINPAFHPYFPVSVVTVGKYKPKFSKKAHSKNIGNLSDEIIIETKDGIRMRMELDGFEELFFWSDDPENYICVEPVAQQPKNFCTPRGIYVSENSLRQFSMKLFIL